MKGRKIKIGSRKIAINGDQYESVIDEQISVQKTCSWKYGNELWITSILRNTIIDSENTTD